MLLAVFLVRGVILPGAEIGIKYYLTPDISKLADARVKIILFVLHTNNIFVNVEKVA